MPTTRSATKQTQLDEYTEDSKLSSAATKDSGISRQAKPKKAPSPTDPLVKRKATKGSKAEQPTKKTKTAKQAHLTSEGASTLDKQIIINRAPVLELWSASVARFLHPDLDWTTCLSIGGAISSICAISKGRAIGVIDPKEDTRDEKSKKLAGQEKATVMGFGLQLKDGAAMLGGKPKPANETSLKSKFGNEEYKASSEAFRTALETWKGKEEELDEKAFHMYERFRPNVSGGQKGWVRKGELNLDEVKNVVSI